MKSTTGGASWFQLDTGLKVHGVENNLTISHLAISTTNGNNFTRRRTEGVFSDGHGTEWSRVAETGVPNDAYTFLKPMGLAVDRTDDRYVYYSLFDLNQGVYKRDGDGAWSPRLGRPLHGGRGLKVFQSLAYPARIFALMYDELPLFQHKRGRQLGASPCHPRGFHAAFLLFLGRESSGFRQDSGRAPTKAFFFPPMVDMTGLRVNPVSGLTNAVLTGMVFSPAVNGRIWAVDLSGGYYCSNDSGSTWVSKADPLSGQPDPRSRNDRWGLYLITDGSGVLKDASPTCP